MSYFNEEQEDHMRYLDSVPDSGRCWCGWFVLADEACHSCPPGKTLAARRVVECPECRNYPSPDGKHPITHRKGCTLETAEERAAYQALFSRPNQGRR